MTHPAWERYNYTEALHDSSVPGGGQYPKGILDAGGGRSGFDQLLNDLAKLLPTTESRLSFLDEINQGLERHPDINVDGTPRSVASRIVIAYRDFQCVEGKDGALVATLGRVVEKTHELMQAKEHGVELPSQTSVDTTLQLVLALAGQKNTSAMALFARNHTETNTKADEIASAANPTEAAILLILACNQAPNRGELLTELWELARGQNQSKSPL